MLEVDQRRRCVASKSRSTTSEKEASKSRAIVIMPARAEWATEVLDRLELFERLAWPALLVGEPCQRETGGDVTRMLEHLALECAMRFHRAARADKASDVDRRGRTHAAAGSE